MDDEANVTYITLSGYVGVQKYRYLYFLITKKAAQTCLPHLLVLISFSCLCAYDVVIVCLEFDFPRTASFIMTLQAVLYHPLFNPIIYGLKMKEITKHLKRLFCQAKVI
ncbi:olfactory receptor 6K3-like [Acanthopagrus schlegelii]